MTVALYPGSFDPFHLGHLDVVDRAAVMFDAVVVAVLGNPAKVGLLSVDDRCELVRRSTTGLANVRCVAHGGLTIDAARAVGAGVIVRASGKEMAAEMEMMVANLAASGLPTTFVPTGAATRSISSTVVRDLLAAGRLDDLVRLVPPPVADELRRRAGAAGPRGTPVDGVRLSRGSC